MTDREILRKLLQLIEEHCHHEHRGLERLRLGARDLLNASPPECGHSACRQYWIDSGRSECVEEGGE